MHQIVLTLHLHNSVILVYEKKQSVTTITDKHCKRQKNPIRFFQKVIEQILTDILPFLF